MSKSFKLNGEVEIIQHKTHEITKIINDKCDLIITMNITRSLAKSICDKNKTMLFFCSCSRDLADLVKERYFIATNHAKIYRTNDYVFLSSSNLSLSSWDEITVKLKRTKELDKFIDEFKNNLKIKNDFVRAFY
jgi:hypothetical protein